MLLFTPEIAAGDWWGLLTKSTAGQWKIPEWVTILGLLYSPQKPSGFKYCLCYCLLCVKYLCLSFYLPFNPAFSLSHPHWLSQPFPHFSPCSTAAKWTCAEDILISLALRFTLQITSHCLSVGADLFFAKWKTDVCSTFHPQVYIRPGSAV